MECSSITARWMASRADRRRCPRTICLARSADARVTVKHLIHNAEQGVERGLDGVPPADGDVSVRDLLENFRVGNEALALVDQPSEQPLRVAFVRVGRAQKIHGNVGIDQNHGRPPEL
jgi:hypothetical protein